ncbi:MAG TPA: hypothetical protein VHM20_07120 [Gammaproteobacteria bacterium]|jgi:hypothetical protein|nr:hypothetical protein [Gammaproteobacteria bacterium]
MQLEDLVLEIVKNHVLNEKLFTALDISNEVKIKMPHARHKDVRDVVRALWSSEIEAHNYDRTAIEVTLADGSKKEALLYHPVSNSWDLDNLYSSQQRQQRANASGIAPNVIQTINGTLSKSNDGTLTVVNAPAPTLPVSVPNNTRDLWAQMWQTQPSLFPRK